MYFLWRYFDGSSKDLWKWLLQYWVLKDMENLKSDQKGVCVCVCERAHVFERKQQ